MPPNTSFFKKTIRVLQRSLVRQSLVEIRRNEQIENREKKIKSRFKMV